MDEIKTKQIIPNDRNAKKCLKNTINFKLLAAKKKREPIIYL